MFYSDSFRIFSCKLLKMQRSHIGRPLVPQVLVTSRPWRSVRRGERRVLTPASTLEQSQKTKSE
jgi:hypothetical protein